MSKRMTFNLWAVMAAFAAVRVLLAQWVPNPLIFPDELVYTKLARSLYESGQLQMRGQFLNFPTLLYPLLLVPAQALDDPVAAFRCVQILNILLVTTAVLPVFLLARLFNSERVAFGIAAASQLLPSTLYSNFAMTESLFFPVLMWVAFFSIKAVVSSERRWKVGLGVALALGFFTKPQGMVVLPVILTMMVAWQALGWGELSPKPTFRQIGARIGCYLPTFAILGMAMGLQVWRALVVSGGQFDAGALFGSYAPALSSVKAFNLFHFNWIALGTFLAVLLSVAILPAVLFVEFATTAIRERRQADMALVLFTVALGGMLIAMTARHTVMLDGGLRLHERYCFHVAPLILIGAAHIAGRQKVDLLAVLLAAVLAGTSVVYLKWGLDSPIIVDSLTLAAALPIFDAVGGISTTVGAAVGLPLLVLAGGILLVRGKPAWACGLLVTCMASLFGLAFLAQHAASVKWGTRARFTPFVAQHARRDRPIAFLYRDGRFWDYYMVEFLSRHQTRLYYLGTNPQGFNDEPAGLVRGGLLTRPTALPDGSRIVSDKDITLDLPILGQFNDVTVYEKRGPIRILARHASLKR